MGKTRKRKVVAGQSSASEENEADVFGEEDELEDAEDFFAPVAGPLGVSEPAKEKDVPLNQVPGKLRKFLTNKD